MSDLIDRQAALDAFADKDGNRLEWDTYNGYMAPHFVRAILNDLPSAQPDRDIPVKPKETTDRSWGIPSRQAVCPKCDCYLGQVAFLGDYKGKRITYCETCGQAIDWEGWDFDE